MASDRIDNDVLYYPTIEFQDETWLKAALCIWDRVYRIVPPEYVPKDSDEVLQAIESGAVLDLRLSTEDLQATAQRFEQFWAQVPQIPAGAGGRAEYVVRLHREKIDQRIRPILEALSASIDQKGWMRLSSRLANSYMLFLSEEVSRRRAMPKLTDSADMYAIIHYFMNDGNFDMSLYDTTKTECSCSLLLETMLPKGLEAIAMREVLKLRIAQEHGRKAFRASVSDFADALSRVEDRSRAQQLATDFAQEITDHNEELRDVLADIGKTTVLSTLIVGVPVAVPALVSSPGGNDILGVSAGLFATGLSIVATVADVARNRRKQWNSHEAAYYLELQRRFGKEKGLRLSHYNVHDLFNEFIND